MENLDNIQFISADPYEILEDMKKLYKEESGDELITADPRCMDYHAIAYYIAGIKAAMNDMTRQNYLRFARGIRLDLKGELYGERGARQTAEKAKTTMRCHIIAPQQREVIIPAETRFIKENHLFISNEEYKIRINETFVDVPIEAVQPGYIPIYAIGEINEIVDRYDYYSNCENISEVIGGVDNLDDDNYRKVLELIPESYSTAGPAGAYEYWTRKTSSLIKDVFVDNPSPNYVDVYILGENGSLITEEIKEKVLEILSSDTVRPQGDIVNVKDPDAVNYMIDFTFYIDRKNEARAIEISNSIARGIEEYKKDINKIGVHINNQDIIALAINNGAKRVEIREPQNRILLKTQIPKCSRTSITNGGIE